MSELKRKVAVHYARPPRIINKYTYKHKQAGLKCCKSYEYITAEPISLSCCPCYSFQYSTQIHDNKRDRLLRTTGSITKQTAPAKRPIPMHEIIIWHETTT